MKSLEFMIALILLVWLFSFLYSDANFYKTTSLKKLEEMNSSLRREYASSIVSSLKAFGAPFEMDDFPKIPSLEGVHFDPATGTYYYNTYSRW